MIETTDGGVQNLPDERGIISVITFLLASLTLLGLVGGFALFFAFPCADPYFIYAVAPGALALVCGIAFRGRCRRSYSQLAITTGAISIVGFMLSFGIGPGGCPQVRIPNGRIVEGVGSAARLIEGDPNAGANQDIVNSPEYKRISAEISKDGGELHFVSGEYYTLYSRLNRMGLESQKYYCVHSRDGLVEKFTDTEPLRDGCGDSQ